MSVNDGNNIHMRLRVCWLCNILEKRLHCCRHSCTQECKVVINERIYFLLLDRSDMTFAVDWALSNNNQSILLLEENADKYPLLYYYYYYYYYSCAKLICCDHALIVAGDVWTGKRDKGCRGGGENRQGIPEAPLPRCRHQ